MVRNTGLSPRKAVLRPWILLGLGRHVALGVEVGVEMVAGAHVVEQLDAADLDHAVPGERVEARGLGIKNDLAHWAPFLAIPP